VYSNVSEYSFFMFPLQSKSIILYLNSNQWENLNRGVERYLFEVKLWYYYFLTYDDSNIIILFRVSIQG